MTKKPAYFTPEQAESLVTGEEWRLLIREGRNALDEKSRKALIAKVGAATSFAAGLKAISDNI